MNKKSASSILQTCGVREGIFTDISLRVSITEDVETIMYQILKLICWGFENPFNTFLDKNEPERLVHSIADDGVAWLLGVSRSSRKLWERAADNTLIKQPTPLRLRLLVQRPEACL